MLEIMTSEAENETANLLVIGVGGAGNNAVRASKVSSLYVLTRTSRF